MPGRRSTKTKAGVEEKVEKQVDPEKLPSASTLKQDQFSEINWFRCNTGIVAWDDNVKEFTGCNPEDIAMCWNCSYPLTDDGYFGGLEWDKDDPENAVLHAALKRLKQLHPLPKTNLGIPICRRGTGVVEVKGSVCCLPCQRRFVEDEHAYNVSEVDGLTTSMGLDAGIPVQDLSVTAFTEMHSSVAAVSIHTSSIESDPSRTRQLSLIRTFGAQTFSCPRAGQGNNQGLQTKFRGHLLGSKAAETVPAEQAEHEDDGSGLTTTEVTYSTNQDELEKLKKKAVEKKSKGNGRDGWRRTRQGRWNCCY